MQQLLADGAPHTFGEIYVLLEGVLRSDDAIRIYSNECPKSAAHLPEQEVIRRGKIRLVTLLLNDMRRYGMMIKVGSGLTSTHQWIFDKDVKQARITHRRKPKAE